MITVNNAVKFSNKKQPNDMELKGLSTDVKPTEVNGNRVGVNSIFLELDTNDFYYFDGEEWQKVVIEGGGSGEYDRDIAEIRNELKKRVYYFDNVASMKSSNDLKAGEYVVTKGYYEKNDGGGASYLIRAKTEEDVDDGGSIHIIGNLVAELIVEDGVNVKQFGAKGDGINDDTVFIQNALDYNNSVYIPKGNFKISQITLNQYQYLYGIGRASNLISQENLSIIIPRNADRSTLENFRVVGGVEIGVQGETSEQDLVCKLKNIFCNNGYGFRIHHRGNIIENCTSGNTEYGFFISGTDNIISNCISANTKKHGYAITNANNSISNSKAFMAGNSEYGAGFYVAGAFTRLSNCESQQNYYENYFFNNAYACNVTSCLSDGAFWTKSQIETYTNPNLGSINTSAILLNAIKSSIIDITNVNGSTFGSSLATTKEVIGIPYINTIHNNSIKINSYNRNEHENDISTKKMYQLVSNNTIETNGLSYNSLINQMFKTSVSHIFEANVKETNVPLLSQKIDTNSKIISINFPKVSDKTNIATLFWDIMVVYVKDGTTKYKNISNQNINSDDNDYYDIKSFLDTIDYDSITSIIVRILCGNKENAPSFTFNIDDLVICTSNSYI